MITAGNRSRLIFDAVLTAAGGQILKKVLGIDCEIVQNWLDASRKLSGWMLDAGCWMLDGKVI